jgi:hypothetical protein
MIIDKQIIGNWGEENGIKLLKKNGYKNIINLNKVKHNFPVFDLLAQLGNDWYVFSSKTRNKFNPSDGKLNRQYNIFTNGKKSKYKLDKASAILKEKFNITEYKKYWITCPIDYNYETQTFYFGNLEDVNGWDKLIKEDAYVGIKMNDEILKTYSVLGKSKLKIK